MEAALRGGLAGRRPALFEPSEVEPILRPTRGPFVRGAAVPTGGCLDRSLRRKYDVGVPELRFEWDARKAAENRRKHGVSFDEAEAVFSPRGSPCLQRG